MTKKFKTEHIIIATFVLINGVLHFNAGFNSGFHGDELLHIKAGRHLPGSARRCNRAGFQTRRVRFLSSAVPKNPQGVPPKY